MSMEQIFVLLFVIVVVFVAVSFAVRERRRRATLTPEQRRAGDKASDREYEKTGGLGVAVTEWK